MPIGHSLVQDFRCSCRFAYTVLRLPKPPCQEDWRPILKTDRPSMRLKRKAELGGSAFFVLLKFRMRARVISREG